MKQFFTAIFVMVSVMVIAQKNNPLSSPYYIYGNTEIGANGEIYLKNVQPKGFSYKKYNIEGDEKIAKEKAAFIFSEIKTNPSIPLSSYPNLQYWRKDSSGDWITDAEGGSGTVPDKTEKYITIVLVLDCSSSLGNDFYKVQNGAVSFINKVYAVSSPGHINWGIVGFSSIEDANRQTFPIKPLDAFSRQEAEDFIKKLTKSDNTALYYAVDKATDMLEKAVPPILDKCEKEEDYAGTYMLIFTDGIDNSSRFVDRRIFKLEEAYNYTKNKLNNTYINQKLIDSYLIGAKGVDIKTSTQRDDFKRILEGFVNYPNEEEERFYYLENTTNLEMIFTKIAENLIKRWQNLVCLTSLAYEGEVCWTLGNAPAAPVVKKTSNSNLFLGVNTGLGFGMIQDDMGALVPVGIDFAYPITNKFGLGAYVEVKNIIGIYYYPVAAIGLMTTVGNYHAGKKTFVGGIGVGFDEGGTKFNLRGGALFRNGLYIMGEFAAGSEYDWYYDDSCFGTQLSLHIGYNFGRHIKIKRKR